MQFTKKYLMTQTLFDSALFFSISKKTYVNTTKIIRISTLKKLKLFY